MEHPLDAGASEQFVGGLKRAKAPEFVTPCAHRYAQTRAGIPRPMGHRRRHAGAMAGRAAAARHPRHRAPASAEYLSNSVGIAAALLIS